MAWLHHLRREVLCTQEHVEALLGLAHEQGLAQWSAFGSLLQACVLAEQGQEEGGIAQMRQALVAYRATTSEIDMPHWLAMQAEAYRRSGQVEAGLRLLAEALAVAHSTGGRNYEAELYRLKGELLLMRSATEHTEAETCFQQALDVARRQQAKSWELRAAMSLARLWQRQGQRVEAYDLLTPIYHWFTEGFDTKDLQEARALLEALQ